MLLCLIKMTAGLAILGLVQAITIDNHLITTKNDCYERLALGQRLDTRDVYKNIPTSTAQECQKECTAEEHRCLSLSFGIDLKGNGTCELSFIHIKETADLQPIGTIRDTDFDLYIKKVDCKLNIPRNPPQLSTEISNGGSLHHPKPLDHDKPHDKPHKPDYLFRPQDNQRPQKFPDKKPDSRPQDGYSNEPSPQSPNSIPPPPLYDHYIPDYLPAPHHKPTETGRPGHGPMYRPDYRPYGPMDYGSSHNLDYDQRPARPDDMYNPNYGSNAPMRPNYPLNEPDYGNNTPNRPNYDNRPPIRPDYGHMPNPLHEDYGNRPLDNRPLDHRPLDHGTLDHRPIDHRPLDHGPLDHRPIDHRPLDHRPLDHRPLDHRPLDHRPNYPYNDMRPEYGGRPDMDGPNYDRPPQRPIGPDYIHQRPLYTYPEPTDKYGSSNYRPEYPPRPSNRPQQLGHPNYYERPTDFLSYPPNYQNNLHNLHNPVHSFRPTYMVAVLDAHRPQRPLYNPVKPYGQSWDRKDKIPDPNNPNAPSDIGQGPIPPGEYDKVWDRIDKKPETNKDDKKDDIKGTPKPMGPEVPVKSTVDVQPRPNGGSVTSIITEIGEPCFRRSLPGKRVTSSFVKRAVSCERVEDCQRECAEEKTFSCEGFNYRLDPAGRVQGDCELTSQPISQLDPGRDVIPDPDFDYYEKDRNMDGDCRKRRPVGGSPPSGAGGGYGGGGGGYGGGGGGYGGGGGGGGPYGGGGGGGYHGGPSGGYDVPRPGGFDGGPRPGGPRPASGGYDHGPRPGGAYDTPRPSGGYDAPRPGGYDHGPSRPGGYDHGPRPYPQSGGGYSDGGRPDGGGYPPISSGPPTVGYNNNPPDGGRPHSGGYPPVGGRPSGGYPPDRQDYGPSRPHDDRPPPRGGPYPPRDDDRYGGHGGPYPPAGGDHRPSGGPYSPAGGDHRPSGGPYPPSGGGGGSPGRPGGGYPPPDHARPAHGCPYMPLCGGAAGGGSGGGSYPPSGGGSGRYPPAGGGGGRYPPASGGSGPYPPAGGGGGPYPPSGGGGYRGEGGGAGAYRPYDDAPKDIGFPRPPYHDYQHEEQNYQPYNRRIDWRPTHFPTFEHRPLYDRQRYHDAYYHDREKDRNYWGIKPSQTWGSYGGAYGNFGGPDSYYGDRRNQNRFDYEERHRFVPYRIGDIGGTQSWGQYGGNYGTGGGHSMGGGYRDMYDYWGFNKHQRPIQSDKRIYHPPIHSTGMIPTSYGVGPRPGSSHPGYDPYYSGGHSGAGHYNFGSNQIGYEGHSHHEHHRPPMDDCSVRSGMGFRLNKAIVKKFFAVPNIHECEKLCYTETEFKCISFAFRYSITLSSPSDNCYLCDRSYKELDFYTDLEPDRDFDIYAMNNLGRHCTVAIIEEQSDCFIRVRSGQRLDHTVVKSSFNCRTIVDCQLECLQSKHFTCRAFSYRFGPAQLNGPPENCQLTDWPSSELDPRVQLMPASGYELYERGSYGHGCENDHFSIGAHGSTPKHTDKVCYVGYASPSRLLPEAAKGSLSVGTEADCKVECTRAREETQFPCMSFSYRPIADKGEPNCELSDIPQSDLVPNVDYARESTSFLFAWDHNNPQCMPGNRRGDTWSMYSVSGWPCKKGTFCQENREAGFWSCELEGGEVGSWDYCCRTDHKCGYSHGYSYPWCYVGPSRDQWRKCSEKYYPYNHNMITDKNDNKPIHFGPSGYDSHRPSHPSRPSISSSWHKEKPFRPPYYHSRPDHGPVYERPTLNKYEETFTHQFLDPPKPGGFGQARHWPVSYLHKESPPNATSDIIDDRTNRKMDQKKYNAISTLMKNIKSEDLKNLQYATNNTSKQEDDEEVLLVRIPMPEAPQKEDKVIRFDVVDTKNTTRNKNLDKNLDFDDLFLISVPRNKNKTESSVSIRTPKRELHVIPVIRRGYVTRTNRTGIRRRRIRPDT